MSKKGKLRSYTQRAKDGSLVRSIGGITIVVTPDGRGKVFADAKNKSALLEGLANGALKDQAGALKGTLRAAKKL